jgi:glutaredoxin|tara:strand:- start:6098 stop:6346 length:249 start_codon:yes stop_codon:yes gene_type:complete
MKKFTVWSKNNCSYCTRAKALMDDKGYEYEERNVEGPDWTPDQFFKAVPPGTRTFPQIFQGDKYIGSYDDMVTHWALGELSL